MVKIRDEAVSTCGWKRSESSPFERNPTVNFIFCLTATCSSLLEDTQGFTIMETSGISTPDARTFYSQFIQKTLRFELRQLNNDLMNQTI